MRLTIEKLIYGGDGLARLREAEDSGERRGKAVFVPFVAAGEVVEARVVEERKGFARAALVEVLEPSLERVAPPCAHFGACGGCQYQHLGYPAQLEAKREILRETLLRGAGKALSAANLELPPIEVHSGASYGFRNRTRMRIVAQPKFAMGYRRTASHELEPVRECSISSPLIQRAIAVMWELAEEAAAHPALREVQFFANHDDSALLVELRIDAAASSAKRAAEELRSFARRLRERMPEIAGVAILRGGTQEDDDGAGGRSARANRSAVPAVESVEGASSLDYIVGGEGYRVSAGAFFQTNRFLIDKLAELVTHGQRGHAALDLYAGVGLFALPLARSFDRVTAVEIGEAAFADLEANAARRNIRAVRSATEAFLQSARGAWDFAVADPPRAGLGERTAKQLAGLQIPRLAIVSCDPATLARDLAVLLAAGYRVEGAHLLDLFPQSFHLETVLHLER